MQTLSTILQITPRGTAWVDEFGTIQPTPRFTAGIHAVLAMQLRGQYTANGGTSEEDGELPPYDVANMIQGCASYFIALDGDYDHATTPPLVRQTGISVAFDDRGYATFAAELPATAYDGIFAALGNAGSIVLVGELGGLDANAEKVFSIPFAVQIDNPVWLPTETSGDTPAPSDPDYLTAAQVKAFILAQVAAGVQLQYSADGASWHDVQGDDDTYFRVRSASDAQAIWSAPIAIPAGGGGGGTGIGAGKITINTSDPSSLANSGVDVYVDWDYWWVNWPRVPGYYGDHIEDAPVAGETSAGWFFVSVVMRAAYSSSAGYKATYTVGIRFTSQYLPQDFPGTAKHVVLAKVYWDGEKYTEVEQWFFGSDIRFLLAAEWYHGPFAVLNTNHVVTLLGGKLICGGTEYSVQDQQLTISDGDRFVYAYLDTSGETPSAGVSVASSLPASSATMQVQPIAQVTYMNQYRITQIWQGGYIRFDSGVSGT